MPFVDYTSFPAISDPSFLGRMEFSQDKGGLIINRQLRRIVFSNWKKKKN